MKNPAYLSWGSTAAHVLWVLLYLWTLWGLFQVVCPLESVFTTLQGCRSPDRPLPPHHRSHRQLVACWQWLARCCWWDMRDSKPQFGCFFIQILVCFLLQFLHRCVSHLIPNLLQIGTLWLAPHSVAPLCHFLIIRRIGTLGVASSLHPQWSPCYGSLHGPLSAKIYSW